MHKCRVSHSSLLCRCALPPALLLLLLTGGVAAGQNAAEPDAAEIHQQRAMQFMKEKRFKEAALEIQAAEALVHSPLNFINEGVAWEQAGQLEDALAAFGRFLDEEGQKQQLRAQVQQKLGDLESRMFGSLVLECQPAGARVLLRGPGGDFEGACPYRNERLRVGSYRLSVVQEGYQQHERTLEVEGGKVAGGPAFELPPLAGRLALQSSVEGALVSIDGLAVGATPLTPRELSPGLHVVQVAFGDGEVWEQQVKIVAGSGLVLQVEPPDSGISWWWIAGGGVAVAAVAAGIALPILLSEDTQDAHISTIRLQPEGN